LCLLFSSIVYDLKMDGSNVDSRLRGNDIRGKRYRDDMRGTQITFWDAGNIREMGDCVTLQYVIPAQAGIHVLKRPRFCGQPESVVIQETRGQVNCVTLRYVIPAQAGIHVLPVDCVTLRYVIPAQAGIHVLPVDCVTLQYVIPVQAGIHVLPAEQKSFLKPIIRKLYLLQPSQPFRQS